MKKIPGIIFCLLLVGAEFLSAPLFAQTRGTNAPAAEGPLFEVAGGFVYMSTNAPSSARVGLLGGNANAILHFSPRWGITADFTYARAGRVPGTRHGDTVYSGLVGPVFFLSESPKTSIFVRGMAGMANVNSAIPINSTTFFSGYETRLSYAVGGGVERAISDRFSVRVAGDYQRTTFVNTRLGLEGQNNLRVITSLVYRFGNR